jgi:hypothetical protein
MSGGNEDIVLYDEHVCRSIDKTTFTPPLGY